MGPWGIIPWDMYINMAASRLLTPTHCIHTEMFLMEAGIIARGINVTWDEQVEELQYDPEDAPAELGINEDWEPQNQVTIDQRKKQLEQQLLPTGECLCGYNKPGRILHECSWDQMEMHNLAWYEGELVTEPWWGKQPAAEEEEYPVYWDMNEGYEQEKKRTCSLATEPWWTTDTKGKGKLY